MRVAGCNVASYPRSNPKSFQALKKIYNAGRFDPEKSPSSYYLKRTFLNSFGLYIMCKYYDVVAKFTTEWYIQHPYYTPGIFTDEFTASTAQINLKLKKIPVNEEEKKHEDDIKPIYIGLREMSDVDARYPLTHAEEKLQEVLKNIKYSEYKALMSSDPDKFFLNYSDPYYHDRLFSL